MIKVNKVYHIDALELLKLLPDNSVDCCVTSPPYFGLRDYGVAGQIGLEATPVEYVQTLVTLFRELRRVLKDSGTFWLNLGDSYVTSNSGNVADPFAKSGLGKGSLRTQTEARRNHMTRKQPDYGLPEKNLLLIPHRVAIALQDDGWICRQDNVWHKPNPMPESVTDRTTRAHEYVFQFAKSGRYWYDADAVREKHTTSNKIRDLGTRGNQGYALAKGFSSPARDNSGGLGYHPEGRNKRSVWTIVPGNTSEAHFATFPLEIPEICIRAGCPPGGLVLDPFMGSGTTALVARAEGRQFIGSELNAEYVEIANKRLAQPYNLPMFAGML